MLSRPQTLNSQHSRAHEDHYDDPSGQLWAVYVAETDRHDKALIQGWKDEMDGILIFAGLFSASVTAFIIESYKELKPDTGELTVKLLRQVTQQLSAMSNGTHTQEIPLPIFRASPSANYANVLWFISLTLSLSSAVAATLVKQWVRNYLQAIERRRAPHRRARMRAYLYEGLQRYKMPMVVEAIPSLLHISLFLFFAGLYEFLLPTNGPLANLILVILCTTAILYIAIALLPLICGNWPYRTPFSIVWWFLGMGLRFFVNITPYQPHDWLETKPRSVDGVPLVRQPEEIVMVESCDRDERDLRAMEWTVECLRDDSELQPFIEGIASFILSMRGRLGDKGFSQITKLMVDHSLGLRIFRHLRTCANDTLLGRDERRRRAAACVTALWPLICCMPLGDVAEEVMLPALDHISDPSLLGYADCIKACVMCSLLKVRDCDVNILKQLLELGSQSSLPSEARPQWKGLLARYNSEGKGANDDAEVITNARFLVLIWIIASLKAFSIPQNMQMGLPFGIGEQFVDGSAGSLTPVLKLFLVTLEVRQGASSLPDSLRTYLCQVIGTFERKVVNPRQNDIQATEETPNDHNAEANRPLIARVKALLKGTLRRIRCRVTVEGEAAHGHRQHPTIQLSGTDGNGTPNTQTVSIADERSSTLVAAQDDNPSPNHLTVDLIPP